MNKELRRKLIEELKPVGGVDQKKLEELNKKFEEHGGRSFLRTLMEEGVVREEVLVPVIAKAFDIPPVDLEKVTLNDELLSFIPRKIIEKHNILPLARMGQTLFVAMFDMADILLMDDMRSVANCRITPVLASHSQLSSRINKLFSDMTDDMSSIMKHDDGANMEFYSRVDKMDLVEISKESTAAPIVKMVDLIISEAIKKGASDIHIEPKERSLKIRYRVDGALLEVFDLPKINQNAIIARIKIMSSLDITETRIPQDGRFRVRMGHKDIDLRVSVLPINHGNKIVLRTLDKSNLSIGLSSLGFLPQPLNDFKKALEVPYGIILVTGPTGSGKSTTLYSVISEMNTPDRNIVTVENPVEYQVEGITQIAAQPEIGLDFAAGLKAILRQSPDVILVGEIRDFETADIAIKASLTGQLVLSTLHTNDSVGAITRLQNMGIEPFLVASSLVMSCAQRLLRRICPDCRTEAKMSPEVLAKIRDQYPEAREVDTFYTGAGCDSCNRTGYKGRLGTLETMLVDDKLRTMINKRKPEADIMSYLKERGFRSLRDNAMAKFIKGMTSLEEVYRVT